VNSAAKALASEAWAVRVQRGHALFCLCLERIMNVDQEFEFPILVFLLEPRSQGFGLASSAARWYLTFPSGWPERGSPYSIFFR